MKIIYRGMLVIACCLLFATQLYPQEQQTGKTGWTIGGNPILGYNSDIGLTYGGLVQLNNYGDGGVYPNYHQELIGFLTHSTGGKTLGFLFFDGRELLWDRIRVTAKLNYMRDIMLPFYGLNGYATAYHAAYEISDPDNPYYDETRYKSRAYYTQHRDQSYMYTYFQGEILRNQLNWLLGFGLFNTYLAPTDVAAINEDLPPEERMPDITLFDQLIEQGRLPTAEITGGTESYLKAGLVYDTRDIEANPMHGIWAEWNFSYFPGW